ncbi:MAG: molybdopterin-dependent oxidoreductase [Acidiphilium sp.]|nr:molybdopterin-dependent oxidoreductase [Acidiphilium sp.]MDD4936755.1 molybdopterin-dependent oxidoreductase [Acidiphilium sp.]
MQAALFNPHTLAPTYPASAITCPARFNAFYDIDKAPQVDLATWRLGLTGRIGDKQPWRIAQLRAMTQESQITRLICVEGWRVVGQWSGVRLSSVLRAVNADLKSRYVSITGPIPRRPAKIQLFRYDAVDRTAIHGGENRGVDLRQIHVVRAITTLGTWTGQSLTLHLAPTVAQHIAILIQHNDGTIAGAATQ